jgi:hypothetical protein
MREAEITQRRFFSGISHSKWVRIAFQLLLVAGFSALTAVAKKIHPSMGIPGSSGVYWLTVMIMGRSVTRWKGAGLLTGLSVGLWSIPIGLEHAVIYNVALYGCAGLLIDITASIPKIEIRHPVGAVLCGFMAHMAKFGFIVVTTLTASVARHFLVVGLLNSALLHAAFGIAAGLMGWGLFKGGSILAKRLK